MWAVLFSKGLLAILITMRNQDIWSILITFAFGFLAGGLLYLGHFSGLVNPDDLETEEDTMEFSITSEAYGGCKEVCPSFQVSKDGSYVYRFTPSLGAEEEVKNGTMPFNIMREVRNALDSDVLVEQSQPVEPSDCHSYNDGIDVKYVITHEGAAYELDSCGTAVDANGALWSALAKLWSHFETVQ